MTVELRPIDLRPNVNVSELLDQISRVQHFYRTRRRNIRPSYHQSAYTVLSDYINNESVLTQITSALWNNEPFSVHYNA